MLRLLFVFWKNFEKCLERTHGILVFQNFWRTITLENQYLSLCPLFFIKFLFFHQMIALQNYEKCFLFNLKRSFCFQDIQIFVIFSFPFHIFQIQKDKWKWNNL